MIVYLLELTPLFGLKMLFCPTKLYYSRFASKIRTKYYWTSCFLISCIPAIFIFNVDYFWTFVKGR